MPKRRDRSIHSSGRGPAVGLSPVRAEHPSTTSPTPPLRCALYLLESGLHGILTRGSTGTDFGLCRQNPTQRVLMSMSDKRLAAAVRYDRTLPAPFVAASGRGQAAERLLALAGRYGVPIETAPELAERLVTIEPGQIIPEQLYEPVAAILAFLLEIDGRPVREELE